MINVTSIGRMLPSPGAVGLSLASSLGANKINLSKLVATRSMPARPALGDGSDSKIPTGLALYNPTASSARLTGSMVLGSLYGQPRPASNMLESFLGKLSSSEYAALSNRFMNIAKDVGLNLYKNDGLIFGDGVAVDIPATEQGGRLLARALARFDQVDDRMGGNQAVQQSIFALTKSMGFDKNKAFMKGLATEAKALQLPWQIQAMSALQTLLGAVPAGARGSINPNLGLRPGIVNVGRKTPGGGGGNVPPSNPVFSRVPFRAPDIPPPTTKHQPVFGGASSAPPRSTSSTPIARPPSVIPQPSSATLTSALRHAAVSNDLRSIENPKQFDTYINNLNGQSMLTVGRVGATGVTLKEVSLSERRQTYSSIKSSDLELGNSPEVNTGKKHDWHLAFGSPSKLGESHASGRAFRIGLKSTWAERGQLPGQGGTKIAQFWRADLPNEYKVADAALTRLESLQFDGKLKTFGFRVTEPLSQTGFIPQGSALSTRLERLEGTIRAQNAIAAEVSKADPTQLPTLLPKLNAANTAVDVSIKQIAAQAVQTRGEMLVESLGTPKTTYELTVRHAAAARYLQSIEAQTNPVFNTAKFKQILAAVKVEAGAEKVVSLKWHREFVRVQTRDATFNEAMQQSPAMRQAWSDYKARYGL